MPMPEERLTEIQTNWTTISSAHGAGPKSQQAMGELVGRYHDALTRYIHLKVRDRHLADEVLQEFWTKLLTGNVARIRAGQDPEVDEGLLDALAVILNDKTLEPAFVAEVLLPPSEADIAREIGRDVDPDAIFRARAGLRLPWSDP